MTTYTIFAETSDHSVSNTSTTYSTARAGSGTKTDVTGTSIMYLGQYKDGANYYVEQGFFSFDTSTVPSQTPVSITLSLYSSPQANKQFNAAERSWSGGTGDFVAGASLSSLTAFGNATFNTSGGVAYRSISGPSDISRTSAYKLIVYANEQSTNVAPASTEYCNVYPADIAGTSLDPKLVIVINLGLSAATGTFTLTGIAASFTYGKNLIAAAGSFVLTGIAAAMGVKRYPPPVRTINFPRSTLEDRTLEL